MLKYREMTAADDAAVTLADYTDQILLFAKIRNHGGGWENE